MKSFLQSDKWAEFQKSLDRKIWQIDSIYIIKYNLPLGKSYLYAPRCGGNFLSESFLNKVKQVAKKERVIFFKAEPLDPARGKPFLEKFGFIKSNSLQPQRTLILNINKSEEKLLSQMHQKTRYNIQLARKKGVKIQKSKNFERFWELLQDTAKRSNFHTHSKKYYKKMLEIPETELFVAELDNKVIAANIVLFYNKRAIYLHGASNYEHRNLMAPYLLQWYQILEAKKKGCDEYDFWGIDSKKWPGVTRFKKGFNGKEISYVGAYDLVFQPVWYKIYKIVRKIL
jgi:lipid II:glycine glycyltransferase (peptidoglycan interpeptide bridge formation enzyme)